MILIEIWKVIPQFNRYEISNFSRVRNIKTSRILKPGINSKNYICVRLYNEFTNKSFLLHRLIALAFIPKIKGKNIINHIDNNTLNNNINNLEWVTSSENLIHSYKTNGRKQLTGEKHPKSKLSIIKVKAIRLLYLNKKMTQTSIAKKYKVDQTLVSAIIRNKIWKNI